MLWSRGLIGSWPLENTALDASGNGHHGTVSGATYTNGQFGRCLEFDGVDDYVDVTGLVNAGTSHTIAFRAYSHDSANASKYAFDVSTGRIIIGWGSDIAGKIGVFDGAWKLFGNSPSANVWHRVALLLNGATGKMDMLLDGVNYGNQLDYTPHPINGTIHIGSRYDPTVEACAFNGLIDETHVWNRLLSAADIRRVSMGMHPIG